MSSSLRRSKRPKTTKSPPYFIGPYLRGIHFENALRKTIESGGLGAIKKVIRLIEKASEDEISSVNTIGIFSALPLAVVICGNASSTAKGTNSKYELELIKLFGVYKKRGMSVDRKSRIYGLSWGYRAGYQRPIVLAAYYGFHRSVEALLDAGATPALAGGKGDTALHAAIISPSRGTTWRACDRLTAELLFRRNVVTSSPLEWKMNGGNQIFLNGANSPLLTAIEYDNIEAAILLVEHGAVLTDHDFSTVKRFHETYRGWLEFLANVEV